MVEMRSSLRVPLFMGGHLEWADWRDKLEGVYMAAGEDACLSSTRPTAAGEEQSKWDASNRKLYGQLVTATQGAALGVVKSKKGDGQAAWKALHSKYEHQGAVLARTLNHQLYTSSMAAAEDPDTWFTHLEDLQRRLADTGHPVDDSMLLSIVISKLPPHYHALRDTLVDPDLTWESVKSRIQAKHRLDLEGSARTGGKRASQQASSSWPPPPGVAGPSPAGSAQAL